MGYKSLLSGVINPYVWGYISYVWGLQILRLGVRFLMFVGLKSLRTGIRFLTLGVYKSSCSGVKSLTFWGFKSLRSRVLNPYVGGYISYV